MAKKDNKNLLYWICGIVFLILILLIPISMVENLIREREKDISSKNEK